MSVIPSISKSNALDPLMAKPATTVAYTDGACKGNPGAGGWGAHLIFSDGRTQDLYGGEANTTNNRMELMGAIQALQHSPLADKLEIWTDSSYVKKGITEWIEGWKKKGWKTASKKPVANQDLWQQLDALCQDREVDWHWVKGHAGHAGNEKADELANLGVTGSSAPVTNEDTNPAKKKAQQAVKSSNINVSSANAGYISDANISDESAGEATSNGWIDNDPLGLDEVWPDETDISTSHTNNLSINNHSTVNEVAPMQADAINSDTPKFDGDTSRANPNFQPLLPKPIHRYESDRQLIMDTETTGLDALKGDRIIEVGIVEIVGRKFTGEKLHVYINPERGMDEEVIRIHGISEAFLQDKPTFDQVAQQLYDFMNGAEIIAHNASFDMNFLNMEFSKVGLNDFAERVQVTDSLLMAKQQYPGQKNTLDALVRRLNVGKQDRTFHGALLDSEILAEVYLAMTGGQVTLAIEEDVQTDGATSAHAKFAELASQLVASSADESAHHSWFNKLSADYPEIKSKILS